MPYFEGWYFKNQVGQSTISIIPGRADNTAFIQIITNDKSYNIDFPLSDYIKKDIVHIGANIFTRDGFEVNIHRENIDLQGKIVFDNLTELRSDIMGPFKYFHMQCRHGVISMRHNLSGYLVLNGETVSFDGGVGYIESDSGRSFPPQYLWMQCNDFADKTSVMLSIAKIPFAGLKFWGAICVIHHKNVEYRLATYRGVKIISRASDNIELRQGKLRFIIKISENGGHLLKAPKNGKMDRLIRENAAAAASFVFYIGDECIFDYSSDNASCEFMD